MRDLESFEQIKKHEKHPWRGYTFIKVAGYIPPWVFFTVFELYKWCKIVQSTTAYLTLQTILQISQQTFTCSKSTIETLEKSVTYVKR